ncbi:vWA domain-containing protein [Magnetococcus sp. PR-3]|uniref:vWA domain-containing protein n=1 Tax=Magnetococcus sp. PR-3 TaxID=3120355 RepID=UPI002FCE002F
MLLPRPTSHLIWCVMMLLVMTVPPALASDELKEVLPGMDGGELKEVLPGMDGGELKEILATESDELKEALPDDPSALKEALNSGAVTAPTFQISCKAGKVCRESTTGLPFRVLPRPASHLFTQQSTETIAKENLKAFSPLFVFERVGLDNSNPAEPKGWYQVGGTLSSADGWMQAKDVMEWRQALVVAYTHPGTGEEARKPVLMFKDLPNLQTLVEADEREGLADALYGDIQKGGKPQGVVSVEPNRFVDIEDNFYILPVLDYQVSDLFDDETRLVKVAAAVPNQRSDAQNQTTLESQTFQKSATSRATMSGAEGKNLTVDLVFVMDLTGSMGPYVKSTKQAMLDLAGAMAKDPAIKEQIRFGFVGYRDDLKRMPSLAYTAKNFTPNMLDNTRFAQLMGNEVRAAQTTSDDYAEEVYAGVKTALNEIPWGDGLRFMVVVGDASAHEPGHKQSTTGLGAAELAQMARDKNIYNFAIHLKEKRYAKDHPRAEVQFSTLGTNPGTESPAYFSIDAKDTKGFEDQVKVIAGMMNFIISAARSGAGVNPDSLLASGEATLKELLGEETAASAQVEATQEMVKQVAAAALVNYLGGEPVRDITFWAMDRDLINPEKRALDVRVLLTKGELNNLITTLSKVIEALRTAEFAELQFFEALQAVMSQVAKGQQVTFEGAKTLSNTQLMPRWIESLPYKSTILDMNNETYEAMQPDERVALERALEAKLQYYVEVNQNVDVWKVLDPRAPDTDKIYPVPLEALP